MSHVMNIVALATSSLLLLAVPVTLLIIVLGVVVHRLRRERRDLVSQWQIAADELGIDLDPNGSDHGPTLHGRVNDHVVSVATLHLGRGRKSRDVTQYSVHYGAPDAPDLLIKQRAKGSPPIVDTGNPKFDAVIMVRCDERKQLRAFLTGPRRAAILRMLTYWPFAEITNHATRINTAGIEYDPDRIVDAICHLVATAETFDRSTMKTKQQAAAAPVAAPGAAETAIAASGMARSHGAHDSDLMTEVRLDEASVLHDLFNSGLDETGVEARFQQVYSGKEINWTGEIVRVGVSENGRQRVAAFIGSADGMNPASGRVVALTALSSEIEVNEGDVVSFAGTLKNLDVTQRLFHVI